MGFSKIVSIIVLALLCAIPVSNAQSQKQYSSHYSDSIRKANVRIWLDAQKEALKKESAELSEPLNYEQTMSDLKKEEKADRLKRINEEIETYKRLVSAEVKNTTPTFGLDIEDKASTNTTNYVSDSATKAEGDKIYKFVSEGIPTPIAYPQTTFSSQREILDFIKTLDFDRNPPVKKLHDFYNDEKKITEDKVLRKGIELYQKGKVKKAVNYFTKISKNFKNTAYQRDYAEYQVVHYKCYWKLDIYYNGIPSLMSRSQHTMESGSDQICPLVQYFFMLAEPEFSTYNPYKLLSYIVKEDKEYKRSDYLYAADKNNISVDNQGIAFTRELLAALLYEAFPKGAKLEIPELNVEPYDAPMKFLFEDTTNKYQQVTGFCKGIKEFFNWMDCLHIMARTDWKLKSYYGIGLSANELYKKAKEIIPQKQFNLYDYESAQSEWQRDKECQILLLRSAYYGHPDAMLELLPYIVTTVQSGYRSGVFRSKFFKKEYEKDYDHTKLYLNEGALDKICAILGNDKNIDGLPKLGPLKDYAYIWEAMADVVNKAYKQVSKQFGDLIDARLAEKRAKSERRKQFWSNLGIALLNGVASGVNAYMQSQYQGYSPMNAAPQMAGNYTGSLADAMSQPGYFQNVQQQLLQQSMNQAQWAEMQEYNSVRENYQRAGRDLSLNEFRALKGQAIANLKEQGYDIIAEQKAINDDMHNFNRSQMNSGKENVERIKQQNALKYGKSSQSAVTTKPSKSYSTPSKTNTSSRTSSSTASVVSIHNTNSYNTTTNTTTNDAHEQYKSGTLNTQKSAYGDKIKNVSMAVKDGSSFRVVTNIYGELYKKAGQYYIKIGNSFFKAENSGGSYNSYIIYGAKAYYFNK